MTIIGKSKAALAMICDALHSNDMLRNVYIYNNLKIEGECHYGARIIHETKTLDSSYYLLGAVMPKTKQSLVNEFKLRYQSIQHKSAFVSTSAKIGDGSIIDSNASVAANVFIGKCVTLYANSSIAHDCVLHDFVTVCPGASVCGDVRIGEGTFVGAGSVIKNGIIIGDNCVIGCGAVVIEDIPNNAVVYGNPAKRKMPCEKEIKLPL